MNNEIMSCFSCVDMIPTPTLDDSSSSEVERNVRREENKQAAEGGDDSTCCSSSCPKAAGNVLAARRFSFDELAMATQNFREANLIGEGGFGSVYKGRLLSSGTVVAVKQLNLEGLQGNQEFVVEVLVLSLLEHPNLVKLIGYCTDGDQRLLVYEFMAMGSLENHLFFDLEEDQQQKPLSWRRRMKIALGAARGLEYLHCTVDPPIIYRDLKSSNILLDREFNVKLSDFGLAKLGPVGDKTHVSTRVMGTYGYCAPEYAMSGKLTPKSDIYSFGVVLLELITGRMAIDSMRKPGEHNLVAWARPFLKDNNNGANKYVELVDPLLQGRFSVKSLHHAVAITTMCLQEQAPFRPVITDIVTALDYIVSDLNNRRRRTTRPTSRTRSSSSSPNSQS